MAHKKVLQLQNFISHKCPECHGSQFRWKIPPPHPLVACYLSATTFGGLRMTSFLPPLSTATAPHNEIICPELRISGAYLPRTQNLRGWPAQKIPAAELIPHQNRSCFLRQNPPNFVWATVPNPLPIFHTLFDLYSTRCRGLRTYERWHPRRRRRRRSLFVFSGYYRGTQGARC